MNTKTVIPPPPDAYADVYLAPVLLCDRRLYDGRPYRQAVVITDGSSGLREILLKEQGWIFISGTKVPTEPVEMDSDHVVAMQMKLLARREQDVRARREGELAEIERERAELLSIEYKGPES